MIAANDVSTIVARFNHVSAASLLGTQLDEGGAQAYLFDPLSSGSYPGLDDFDRVVHSTWTGNFGYTIYDVTLSYDYASNITSAVDAIHKSAGGNRAFDVKYTLDGLNRLTQAEEGTYATGSISNRSRQEDWTLTQPGSWATHLVDLNGDNDRADGGGEMAEHGTVVSISVIR